MQKIKNHIIDKMIEMKLTSNEIDFMICISRYQNENGKVLGVHYKKVCEEMKMSYQSFYDVKGSLCEKGLITCRKSNLIDHDITIVGNQFGYNAEEKRQAGYINTAHDLFSNSKYLALRAGAKLLAIELLRMSYFGNKETRGQFHIGTKRFYEKYEKIFQVSKRVLRSYLMDLKDFFSIGIVDRMYYVRPKVLVYKKPGTKSENDNLIEHNVGVICKRNRMTASREKQKKDLYSLCRQYRNSAESLGKNIYEVFTSAVVKSIQMMNESHKKIKDREIYPKLIHKCMREELAF